MEASGPNIPAQLIAALREARHLAVLTGAGISAESGLPTFREAQTGLWSKYRPEELATPQAFQRDPQLVWRWYAWRRELVKRAQPNAGHLALAQLEALVPRVSLITQNVDGLHRQAGSSSVIELHGNIRRSKCFRENLPVAEWEDTGELSPRCPRCSAYLRPDVVWFGESLSADALEAAWSAAEQCDLFFSIGTSGLVQPAASLPYVASRSGAVVAVINPDPDLAAPPGAFFVRGPAGTVLPALIQAVWPEAVSS